MKRKGRRAMGEAKRTSMRHQMSKPRINNITLKKMGNNMNKQRQYLPTPTWFKFWLHSSWTIFNFLDANQLAFVLPGLNKPRKGAKVWWKTKTWKVFKSLCSSTCGIPRMDKIPKPGSSITLRTMVFCHCSNIRKCHECKTWDWWLQRWASRFIFQTLDVEIKEYVDFAKDMNQQRTWNRCEKDFEKAVPILFKAQVFPTLLINIVFEYSTL